MIKKFHLHINITPETTITNDESIVDNNKTTNKLLADAIKLEETGVYIGTTNGSIWHSDNEGNSWRQIITHLPKIYALEVGYIKK